MMELKTLGEAKKFLNDKGIKQLRRGESLQDCLDSVANNTARKGYDFKHDSGRLLTQNEIIQRSNKEAFLKTVSPKEYLADEVDEIDDISDSNDYREDKEHRGAIANCYYCGDCIRIDGFEDYDVNEPEVHCDGCMKNAIANLAM